MDLKNKKSLHAIYEKIVYLIPNQQKTLINSFKVHSDQDLELLEILAEHIICLVGNNLEDYIRSYQWMLGIFKEELFYFIKNNKYRISTFKKAYEEIYSNSSYMEKYMQGLLLSQLIWPNHAKSFLHFYKFIEKINKNFNYLEIGPGRGLYLALVGKSDFCKKIEAWDVSNESLKQTKESVEKLNINKKIKYQENDILNTKLSSNQKYDLIMISEVLEHLENPSQALNNCNNLLSENGIIYISFPINSPAPDHIFLLRSINEVENLIKNNGFNILSSNAYPSSGYSLQKAIDLKSSISCIITAKKS